MKNLTRYIITLMTAALLMSGCSDRSGELERETEALRRQLQAASISRDVLQREYLQAAIREREFKARIKRLEDQLALLEVDYDDRLMTREAFREKVVGMSTDELIKLIGKPITTSADKQWWSYRISRTYDAKTRAYDVELKFAIEEGRVKDVFFK